MTQTDLQQTIDRLIEMIGPTLVAFLTDARTRTEVTRWGQDNTWPNDDQIERLVLADELLAEVSYSEGANIARAWFIGTSCGTDGNMSPAEAVRCDNFDDAKASAARFISAA